MTRVLDLIYQGGPTMIPLVGMSVMTFACALERGLFWFRLLSQEDRIVKEVLEAARHDLGKAAAIAEHARLLPIGRFLLAPLKLIQPTPETFRLAMEAAADKEFAQMRRGDKLLESVVGIAPLLGLLGTVTGLIATFSNLNIGAGGTADGASKAAAGIGEALITTAGGMIVAIIALFFFRILVTLQAQQTDYFSEVGSELELIYRQCWYEPSETPNNYQPSPPSSTYAIKSPEFSRTQINSPAVSGRWSVQLSVDSAHPASEAHINNRHHSPSLSLEKEETPENDDNIRRIDSPHSPE
ncbi:MAG TPA: biopolymer transporter ExbB [Cyanobacteria bacterium UBA11149]|nr:biopolymer transporter ExbB [Cyanobacteria bacterium UBA11367]HBE57994.1 biopolymer transporter ExbB [Cyanobacteria bacterium UBA11366]HBK62468.1 biopolymer transporter ExbB [Cyanobacteria bacterium UBA11166]HBR73995.1 biopolymer transporter ExbB [Cyanobacteria bacterium UBA11159]HBS72104.1 biopolymer transporter ExbB [Cyanobacteria bacterium UBA11153]HBW91291.1 biopolymer transporter ExbB [Cyanobacteria bacterium UBA11149]HCA96243.1 biopolymer transporter ExbB [Cyanobacteria bacterium UBA